MSGSRYLHPILRFSLAFGFVSLAILLQFILKQLSIHPLPFLFLYPAVFLTAWLCGFKPGIFATLLSSLGADLFFLIGPGESFANQSFSGLIHVFIFFCMGVAISWSIGKYHATAEEVAFVKRAHESSRKVISDHDLRFRSIVMNSPSALSVKDLDGRYLIANPNYDRILGIPSATMLGKTDDELFPLEVAHHLKENHERVVQNLESFSVEETIPDANGTSHTFHSHKFPILDLNGKLDSVCSISLDITARKKFEQDIQTGRAQLEATFQAMADGIMVFDMKGNPVLINEAQARINGFPDVASIRRNLAFFAENYELFYLDGTTVPVDQWPISRVLRGETIKALELGAHRKDINRRWIFSFTGEPVCDAEGRQMFALVISRDITELKRPKAIFAEPETELPFYL